MGVNILPKCWQTIVKYSLRMSLDRLRKYVNKPGSVETDFISGFSFSFTSCT
jgi:hypothetical protein